jgi:hypothetical protein
MCRQAYISLLSSGNRFFSDRARGEFLTRGAALASQQSVAGEFGLSGGDAHQVYPPPAGGPPPPKRAILTSTGDHHQVEQLEREPRRYEQFSTGGRGPGGMTRAIVGGGTKENRRPPTILRKSTKLYINDISGLKHVFARYIF